jgi:hypothetical protein
MTDKGVREEMLAGLEVRPGKHPETGKHGFFVYDRANLGNFPICWKPTEQAARAYGIEFMKPKPKKR